MQQRNNIRQRNTNANTNTNTNVTMTTCHKGGIKIKDGGNGYIADPFAGVDPFTNPNEEKREQIVYNHSAYDKLDLNIENYSRNDLYNLFGLKTAGLTEDIMKECKKVVLKTHPDKSRLETKYFLFFSKAYKKLKEIYDFQNKTTNKVVPVDDGFYDEDNKHILDKVFDTQKDLKDPKNFNNWFNRQFDKHKLDDPGETGYGSWLKSDEDIVYTPNVTMSTMASEMEKRKKEVQTLTNYTGTRESCASTFGGSSLMAYDSNFSSGSLFSGDGMGYTDLRQAYVESVIPVTAEDYNKTKQFKTVDEYKRHRDATNMTPLSKEEAMRQLYHENKNKDEESAALAFYYAEQSEKAKQSQHTFWSGLKQVTNW